MWVSASIERVPSAGIKLLAELRITQRIESFYLSFSPSYFSPFPPFSNHLSRMPFYPAVPYLARLSHLLPEITKVTFPPRIFPPTYFSPPLRFKYTVLLELLLKLLLDYLPPSRIYLPGVPFYSTLP